MLNTISGMLAGGVAPTDYESIQTVTVGSGGASSISFTSIPSTYSHLQIRAITRTTATGDVTGAFHRLNFNSDTGNNYTFHVMKGDGSTATAAAITPFGNALAERTSTAFQSSGVFGALIWDILDYANTNKYKTLRALAGFDNNGSGQIALNSSSWMNTATVTQIDITPAANNWAQYSSFALYGIK